MNSVKSRSHPNDALIDSERTETKIETQLERVAFSTEEL